MKKLTALLLILCLLLPMAACGAKEEPTQPTQPSQPTEPTTPTTDPTTPAEPTEPTAEPTPEPEKQWLPLVEPAGSKKISIGIMTKANVTDYDDNAETKWYEEQTGIDLEFRQFAGTSSDCGTQVALMIASGETLPDVFISFSGISKSTGQEYGLDGYFLDLRDYFADPDMTHFFDQAFTDIFGEEEGRTVRSQLLSRATETSDGGIYCFPWMEDVPMDSPVCHAFINEDWLKKLNLEIPHTIDELYNVLVHFRDDDPNGNGKKDEIPLTGRANGSYVDCVEWICNAFIYTEFSNHFNVEKGKLYTPYATDEYRQALCFIKKLVDEGLMPTNFFTQSASELKALINPTNDTYLVGIACGHPDAQWLDSSDSVRHYVAMGPLADATGKGGYGAREYYSMYFNHFITCDCSDPELAFRMLDFMCSGEAYVRQRWGEEGVDWVRSDGKGNSSAGNTPYVKLLNPTMWSQPNAQCWHYTHAIGSEYFYSYEVADFDPNDWDSCRVRNLTTNYALYLEAGLPDEVYYFGNYNAAETEERADFTSDLTSYISKSRANFLSGNLDPNNDADWNNYLDNLKTLKYDRWIEIAQTAWDRENQGSNYISY